MFCIKKRRRLASLKIVHFQQKNYWQDATASSSTLTVTPLELIVRLEVATVVKLFLAPEVKNLPVELNCILYVPLKALLSE